MRAFVSLFVLCMILAACAGDVPQIPAQAEIGGQAIRTTVDSDIAKYFLEHYLKGERLDAELDATIAAVERDVGDGRPSRGFLKSVAERHSTDFAALILWQSLSRHAENRRAQQIFNRELSRLKAHTGTPPARRVPNKPGYLIVFAPGWFYKSQPENGADFAKPRQALSEAGVATALLEIDENGTVERNADAIAKQLAALGDRGQKIVVVSASKAGPEVALALSQLRAADTKHGVTAWVNIGGVLRGSALADRALTWPTRWYVKHFIIDGGSFDGIDRRHHGPRRS